MNFYVLGMVPMCNVDYQIHNVAISF